MTDTPADEAENDVDFDPLKYRKRTRAIMGLVVGAAMAGITWLVLFAFDSARNPCERVRDYLCHGDAKSLACTSYQAIAAESVNEKSQMMRSNIRSQCETKIERLKNEEGIKVP